MSDLRLQNLAILSIEQEITNNISFESIIRDFSNMKVRRVNIYIYICSLRFPRMGSMLLEIFPESSRVFESFTRRFGSPFGAIFKRGGGWSTWS